MTNGMKNGFFKIDVRLKNISSMIMGDAESDEHLRIFKCLIDTGSIVLRNAIGIKVLHNNSIRFDQYLENYKHQFYHQFEKNIRRKCCPGRPHGCVVNGTMDKKIFYKMYNKTAEHNYKDCLDRFEIKAGISLDMLDLSDLNFFLWNSSSLSALEENSLKKIMSIRSAICHPSSSHSYSTDELEKYWSDLESAVVLFAEPKYYKDIVEMQIKTLQNCKLNVIESAKIIEKMKTESDKILQAIQQETPLKIDDIEKLIKDGTGGLKECVMSENNKTISYIKEFQENCEKGSRTMNRCKKRINAKVQREGMKTRLQSKRDRDFLDTKLTDSERTVCRKVKSNKRRLNKMLKLTQEGMNQNSKRFKSMETQQTENNKTHQQTTIKCKDEMTIKVKEEGRKTRLHNEDQNKAFDKKLTETEMRFCQTVEQSTRQLSKKMQEEANDTRRHNDKRLIYLEAQIAKCIGLLGKQTVYARTNQEHLEESTEKSDTQDIYITSKLDQQCLTADKERNVIENLQSEIQIPPSNDTNLDTPGKQAFQVIVKKVNSIILKMKATPGIFKSVETLKFALLTLVKNVQIAGKIDVEIEDTVTVDLSFDSPLTKDEIAVVKCLFSKQLNDDNNDTQLSKEHSSSAVESYLEHESSSHQAEAVTRPLCQACAEKDKQIKAYEEKTREHEKSIDINKLQGKSEYLRKPTYQSLEEKFKQIAAIEAKVQENQKITAKYKLQGVGSTIRPYNCRNCFEKDDIIIQLDRQLCQIRRHLFQIKENQLEKSVSEGDLVKLITLAADTICADESTRIAEKETKSNISSLRSDKMAVDSDVHHNRTKTLREDIEIQSGEGSLDKPYHPSEKSDVNSRLLEIKREYARNFYTKTAEQKGLAIILAKDKRRWFPHKNDHDTAHFEEFFEEIGFIIIGEGDLQQLSNYMTDGQFYCIFIVFSSYDVFREYEDTIPIRHYLSHGIIGKPVIIMTDFRHPFYFRDEDNENNDILIVQPTMQTSIGPYRHPGYKNIFDMFDDFMKVTRSNRFADVIDILTRINSLYDYPLITFLSTLRKKLCFV